MCSICPQQYTSLFPLTCPNALAAGSLDQCAHGFGYPILVTPTAAQHLAQAHLAPEFNNT